MKLFTKKKVMQKMTIVLVFLILFNFITPTYSRAAWHDDLGNKVLNAIAWASLKLGDVAINFMQHVFIGTDAVLTKDEQMKLDGYSTSLIENAANGDYNLSWWAFLSPVAAAIDTGIVINDVIHDGIEINAKSKQYDDIYQIQISPWKIFSGTIYALNIDFISSPTESSTAYDEDWYKDYNNALKKMEEHISSLGENDSDELFGWTYAYVMTRGTDAEIANKVSYWYKEMDNTYSDEAFYSVIAMKSLPAFEENALKRTYVIQALQQSGMCNVVSSISGLPGGANSILNWAAQKENSPAVVLHDIIATWYRIMRNIALVALLCILVYVGIRIMISSTAADSSKYKKMLVDWVVAVCILFALHYIMAFAVNLCQLITNAFVGSDILPQTVDEVINEIRKNADGDAITNFGYIMVYLVLVLYTIYFLFYYVKRVVYAAFLTLIAPLVAVTYPVDKMADGRSQAFDMWVREYVMNIIMQPLHLLIYTAMVTTAITLAKENPIYAIVVIGAMIPIEKFIKEMFGIGPKKGPNGGPLVGAAVLTGMQKLAGRKPPKFPSPEDKDKGTTTNEENSKKPRMDSEKIAELSRSIIGGDENDNSANPRMRNTNTSTENQPGIDDGNFEAPAFGFANNENDENNLPDIDNTQMMPDDESNGMSYANWMGNENEFNTDEFEDAGEISFADLSTGDTLDADNEDENLDMDDTDSTYDFGRYNFNTPIRDMARGNLNNADNASEDINNIRINANNSNNAKTLQKKKRNIKAEAARATAVHYKREILNFKNLKKVLKGAAKIGGGVIAGGVGATVGLAAGVASGDPSKALQFTVAGGFAGSKIGSNAAENLWNTAGFVAKAPYHVVRDVNSTYQENLKERLNYDDKVKKEQKAKLNRKYAKSKPIQDAIKKRYGYSVLDSQKINAVQSGIERYKNKGIDDLDTIFNCINLENGIDSQGNDIGERLTQDQAMLVGLMHEQGLDRKSVKEQMKLQLADNYYADGANGITEADSVTKAKEPTKHFMKWYDMASGISIEKAGRADVQEELKDAKDEARRLQNIEDQAKAIEKANQRAQRRTSRENSRNTQPRTPRNQPTGPQPSGSNRRTNPINPGNSLGQDINEPDSDNQ